MVAASEVVSRAESVHHQIAETVRQRRKLAHQLGALLRIVDDERLFAAYGHATVAQYAKKEHGISARACRDYLRVARRFDELPEVERAYAAGELDKSKVREIVRVATKDTQDAWIQAAKASTNRVLEQLVAHATPDGLPPGEIPEPPLGPAFRNRTFRFRSCDLDKLEQILALFRSQVGPEGRDIEDGDLITMLAQFAAEHATLDHVPTDAEPVRVVLTETPEGFRCGENAVDDTILEEAACDCVVTDVTPGPKQGHSVHSIPPAARMTALASHDFRCAVPDCRCSLFLHVHHIRGRSVADAHHPDNLVPLCSIHHRIHHDGYLGVERLSDGRLRFSFRNGVAHVGRPRGTPSRRPGPKRRFSGLVDAVRARAAQPRDPAGR